MFDFDTIPVKRRELRMLPDIPDTGWRPPKDFPNLSAAVRLSVDTETYDPELKDRGPGWARGSGHIVGFSIGAVDAHGNRGKWYFPIRHTVGKDLNLDETACLNFLRESMATPVPKVGTNLTYDIGWLKEYGIDVKGELHDTMFAEALLSEGTPTGLDHCAAKYLGEHKDSDLLYEWCAEAYGGNPTGAQRANIYRSPPQIAGLYGEADADLPLRIIEHQLALINAHGLSDVYRMECDLIPLMVDMRFAGMPVDLDAAERLREELATDITAGYADLHALCGVHASVNSSNDLAKVFDAVGLPYPRTEHGNPSFVKEFLEGQTHPVARQILKVREMEKIRGTFVQSYILDSHVNGKVHGQFHQLKGDDGGAKTGRFASSNPNLQNIPSRTELGLRVRSCIVGEQGHDGLLAKDYSSVEYKVLAHFAVGEGSEEVRRILNDDPSTDYHQIVMDMILNMTGIQLTRKHTKNINFASLYGAGAAKIALMLGCSLKEAEELLEAYHKGAPYVQATMDDCMATADRDGHIRTIMGRMTRFDKWEPMAYDEDAIPLPFDQARSRYGNRIRKAGLYKATNYKIQGTAAEVMKAGMLACYKSGVFNVTGVPIATVHDELVFSLRERTQEQHEAYQEIERLLVGTIPLRLPLTMDTEMARDWGSVKETDFGRIAA